MPTKSLHGKHIHVKEKALLHWSSSDGTPRLLTVMRHWTGEADRAHKAGKRAARLAAKQRVRQEHGGNVA